MSNPHSVSVIRNNVEKLRVLFCPPQLILLPYPALALQRHLSIQPLDGGSASKACPEHPSASFTPLDSTVL